MHPRLHHETVQDIGGRRYLLTLSEDNTIVSAKIEVRAHDKVPTWRKVFHKTTLARLQGIIRPAPVCPACGQAVKGDPS